MTTGQILGEDIGNDSSLVSEFENFKRKFYASGLTGFLTKTPIDTHVFPGLRVKPHFPLLPQPISLEVLDHSVELLTRGDREHTGDWVPLKRFWFWFHCLLSSFP